MSISFLAAAVAALAAAVATGLLVRECVRLPRLEVIPWTVAAAGLMLALAAQAIGYHSGFTATTFRGVQLGAQLLAPLALMWGLAEVAGRGVAARFVVRLVVAGAAAIALVIMATDPLTSTPFSQAWPPASQHYQYIPNGVLMAIAAGTVIAAVVAVSVAWFRGRGDRGWHEAFLVTLTGGAGTVVLQLLRLSLPVNAAYAAVCLAAAAAAWLAGVRSDVYRLGLRENPAGGGAGYPEDEDEYAALYRPASGGGRRQHDTGWGQYDGGAGYREPGPDTGYGSYPGGPGDPSSPGYRDISDTGYGFYRDDTDGLRAISDTGYGLYRDEGGGMVFGDGPGPEGAPGFADAGFRLPESPSLDAEEEEEGTARLYGQIAIYTLLEARAEEFDRLAQDVVAKVKAREPETLVFVMHGVPSAPMQRILYEVYRDQAAYEHHSEQSYVRDFEERRAPYVLATNVIELGVRQAKVSPLLPGAENYPPPARPAPPAPRSPAPPVSRPPEWRPPGGLPESPDPLGPRPAGPPQPASRPRSRRAPEEPRPRQHAASGDDGDFWTRSARDPQEDDSWNRRGRYP